MATRPVKQCVRCAVTKDVRSFDKDTSRPDGRYPWCKLCRAKYSPSKQQDISDELNGHVCPLCDTPIRGHANRRYCSSYCKERASALRKKFGLTVDQYKKLISATGGHCPICKKRPRKWNVDHDHKTGLVTGVVCVRCNVGVLAYSNHDTDMAVRLADYLQAPPATYIIGEVIVPEDPDGTIRGRSKLHGTWRGTN